MPADLSKYNLAVVIPVYRGEHDLGGVLASIPAYPSAGNAQTEKRG